MEDSPKKHALRSRLSNELFASKLQYCYTIHCNFFEALKSTMQPFHSVVAIFPDLYNSAMLAGDVENTLMSHWNYCAASFITGAMNLKSLLKQFVMCIKDAVRFNRWIWRLFVFWFKRYLTNYCRLLHFHSTPNIQIRLNINRKLCFMVPCHTWMLTYA